MRRILLTFGLLGALVALILPTLRFLGVGPGWAALYLSFSLLVELIAHPTSVAQHGLFLSRGEWHFVALLWLPALLIVAAGTHLFRRTPVAASTALRIFAVLSTAFTAAAPLCVTTAALLIGFWLWLVSLISISVALFFPVGSKDTTESTA